MFPASLPSPAVGMVVHEPVGLNIKFTHLFTNYRERLHACQSESGWQSNYYVDLQTSKQVVTGGVYRHASAHCANRAR